MAGGAQFEHNKVASVYSTLSPVGVPSSAFVTTKRIVFPPATKPLLIVKACQVLNPVVPLTAIVFPVGLPFRYIPTAPSSAVHRPEMEAVAGLAPAGR